MYEKGNQIQKRNFACLRVAASVACAIASATEREARPVRREDGNNEKTENVFPTSRLFSKRLNPEK